MTETVHSVGPVVFVMNTMPTNEADAHTCQGLSDFERRVAKDSVHDHR